MCHCNGPHMNSLMFRHMLNEYPPLDGLSVLPQAERTLPICGRLQAADSERMVMRKVFNAAVFGVAILICSGRAFGQSGTCSGMSLGQGANLNGFVPFPSSSL